MPLEIIDEVRPRKQERATLRQVVMAVYNAIGVLCLLFLIGLAATWPTNANAGPRFQVESEGARIVLFDDKCELTDQIANLPYKATWTEKGKTFRGCWGARPDVGVVMGYFEDKTMALIPMQAVTPVQGV